MEIKEFNYNKILSVITICAFVMPMFESAILYIKDQSLKDSQTHHLTIKLQHYQLHGYEFYSIA